jgi:serine/threonine protein phosphatase PrpC
MHFRIHSDTNTGKRRENNEDSVIVDKSYSLIVLADGMGGHKAGEIASKMATDSVMGNLRGWIKKCKEQTISRNLRSAVVRFINQANNQIHLESLINYEKNGMGTTIVVAVIRKGKLTLAHVGDSRAYLFRNNILERLTIDHTKAQEQMSNRIITLDQAIKSPFRHYLTRAVGNTEQIEVDIQQVLLSKGDKILICSDGLTDMLSDQEIKEILSCDLALEESVAQLIRHANNAGGLDNISVALATHE